MLASPARAHAPHVEVVAAAATALNPAPVGASPSTSPTRLPLRSSAATLRRIASAGAVPMTGHTPAAAAAATGDSMPYIHTIDLSSTYAAPPAPIAAGVFPKSSACPPPQQPRQPCEPLHSTLPPLGSSARHAYLRDDGIPALQRLTVRTCAARERALLATAGAAKRCLDELDAAAGPSAITTRGVGYSVDSSFGGGDGDGDGGEEEDERADRGETDEAAAFTPRDGEGNAEGAAGAGSAKGALEVGGPPLVTEVTPTPFASEPSSTGQPSSSDATPLQVYPPCPSLLALHPPVYLRIAPCCCNRPIGYAALCIRHRACRGSRRSNPALCPCVHFAPRAPRPLCSPHATRGPSRGPRPAAGNRTRTPCSSRDRMPRPAAHANLRDGIPIASLRQQCHRRELLRFADVRRRPLPPWQRARHWQRLQCRHYCAHVARGALSNNGATRTSNAITRAGSSRKEHEWTARRLYEPFAHPARFTTITAATAASERRQCWPARSDLPGGA